MTISSDTRWSTARKILTSRQSVNALKVALRSTISSLRRSAVHLHCFAHRSSLQHLRKVYAPRGNSSKKTVAVKDLSLGLPAGNCFGFLGTNGAGKTTTMSILTGDDTPTAGRAWINGFDVVNERQHVRQYLGYCPRERSSHSVVS